MISTVCWGCKRLAEIVHTDHLGFDYCADCAPVPREVGAIQFLLATPPFEKGDRVECRTGAEIYEGIGTVEDMSFDFEHGGSIVYPAFLVKIDEPANEYSPAEGWWNEVCLTKVAEK